MDLILTWLNNDIGLSPPVKSFERDFSNGYLFAKLLHLYNQNPNLSSFINKSASNAKISNFSLLEPLFRSLRIRFDSKIAYEIITCKTSVALNLVRDLKMCLERMASRPTAVVGRPRQSGQLPVSNMPLRLTRPTFDKAQHELFVKSIKIYIRGQNQVDMAQHLRQFTDHRVHLEETAQQAEVDDLREFFAQNDRIRQQRRLNLQREHEFLHDWQEKGIEEWAYNQQIKREREEHARRQVQRRLELQERRQESILEHSRHDVTNLIPEFQKTLLRTVPEEDLPPTVPMLNVVAGAGDGGGSTIDDIKEPPILPDGSLSEVYKINASATVSRLDFWKEARDKAGHPDQWKEEAEVSMERMKVNVERRKNARAQSERRRRKFLSDSQSDRNGRSTRREKDRLARKLLRKPKNEKKLEISLSTVGNHADMFIKNRESRDEAYDIRRQQDAEDAINRDNEYYYNMRINYETEVEEQKLKYNNYLNSAADAEHHRNIEMAQTMLQGVLQCVHVLVQRRRMLEAPVEIEVARNVVQAFVQGLQSKDVENAATVVSQEDANNLPPSSRVVMEITELSVFRQVIGSAGEPPLETSEERQISTTFNPSDVMMSLMSDTAEEDEKKVLKELFRDRPELMDNLTAWLESLEEENGLTMDDIACSAYLCVAYGAATASLGEDGGNVTATLIAKTMVSRPDVYPQLLLSTPLLSSAVTRMSDEVNAAAADDESGTVASATDGGEAEEETPAGNDTALDVVKDSLTSSTHLVTSWYSALKEEEESVPNLCAWCEAAGAGAPVSAGTDSTLALAAVELGEYLRGTGMWQYSSSMTSVYEIVAEEAEEVTESKGEKTKEMDDNNTEKDSTVSSANNRLPSHQLTGSIVSLLKHVVVGPPPPTPPTNVPRMEMTIVLLGKPFTGKTTQAKRLSEKYNLAIIDVPALLHEAAEFGSMNAQKTEVMSLEGAERLVDDRWYHDEVAVIGKDVRNALMSGAVVPDELLVGLITTKIRLIHQEAQAMREVALREARTMTTPRSAGVQGAGGSNNLTELERKKKMLQMLFEAWDVDNSGEVDVGEMVTAVRAFGEGQSDDSAREEALEIVQQMDADQDGRVTWEEFDTFFTRLFDGIPEKIFDEVIAKCLATTTAKPYKGWVLDGYPTTSKQAQLLERALTGYTHVDEEERSAPNGVLDAWSMALASRPPLPKRDPEALYGKSGIDVVLSIDITNEEVYRRALGRRYDPILKKTFHIETNPPSMDEPVKMRLLEPQDMTSHRTSIASDLQLRDVDAYKVEQWYDMFDNRQKIVPFLPWGGASLGEDALFDVLCRPLDNLLQTQMGALNEQAKADQLEVKRRNLIALYDVVAESLVSNSDRELRKKNSASENVSPFVGEYTDINHPGCPRAIAVSEEDGVTVTVTGHDGDESTPFECTGTLKTTEAGGNDEDSSEGSEETPTTAPAKTTLVLDLSAKGGPSDLEGMWTGTGIRWIREGENQLNAEEGEGWTKVLPPSPVMDVEGVRGVLSTVVRLAEATAEEIRGGEDEEQRNECVTRLQLPHGDITPKEIVQYADELTTAHMVWLAENETVGKASDDVAVNASMFADAMLSLCGEGVSGKTFSNVYSMMPWCAKKTGRERTYRLGRMYNTWTIGPKELEHVNIVIGLNSRNVLVKTQKARAKNDFERMTEMLKEERRLAIAAENGEDGEVAEEKSSKMSKSASKSKVAQDDVGEENEEDLPPLVYPPLPFRFDLGELDETEEDEAASGGKGKKGKKGAPAGGDEDGPPPATPPEEIGDVVEKNDFVEYMNELFTAHSTTEENAASCELTMSALLDIVDDLIEHARANAPPPPEPEPAKPRNVPEPPLLSAEVALSVEIVEQHGPLAAMLYDGWNCSVDEYVSTMTSLMSMLATLRGRRAFRYQTIRERVHEFIARGCHHTGFISQLQKKINSIPQDMRYHDEVKAELHERVSDTMNTVHASIEQRESETMNDLTTLESDGYVEMNIDAIVKNYVGMMQAEVDRHHDVRTMLVDHMVGAQQVVELLKNTGTEGDEVEENLTGSLPIEPPCLDSRMFGNVNADEPAADDKKGKGGKGKKGKGKDEPVDEVGGQSPLAVLDAAISIVQEYLTSMRATETARRQRVQARVQEEREKALAEVEGDVGGKGKKGGKDAKGKAAEPEETSGDDVAKEQDDLARALSHEEEELTRKLNRLQLVCSDVVERSIQYSATFMATLRTRAKQRYTEERANISSATSYMVEQIEAELPLRYLVGVQDTTDTVVQRQEPVLPNVVVGPLDAPPMTSWTGPKGNQFFVDESIGMVRPADPMLKPAVETFSDVALAPSQSAGISAAFAKAVKQCSTGGGNIAIGEAVAILQRTGASGLLPKQWSTLSLEQLRQICQKYVSETSKTLQWDEMLRNEFPVAGADEHSAALKMQGIMRKRRAAEDVARQRAVKAAEAKFNEIDDNGNGFLDGDEIVKLAEWVWSSFHPGGKPVSQTKRDAMAKKLIKRVADSPNGQISFDSFEQWFRKIAASMEKFQKFQQRSQKMRSSGDGVVDTSTNNENSAEGMALNVPSLALKK